MKSAVVYQGIVWRYLSEQGWQTRAILPITICGQRLCLMVHP